MAVIIALLIATALSQSCYKQTKKFYIPRTFWPRATNPTPNNTVILHKNGAEIGKFLPGKIQDHAGVFVNISETYITTYFKPATSSYFEFYINTTKLGSFMALEERLSSSITVTDQHRCGHNPNQYTLWYIKKHNKIHRISTTTNHLHPRENYTYVCCYLFQECKLSDILYSNGTRKQIGSSYTSASSIPAANIYLLIILVLLQQCCAEFVKERSHKIRPNPHCFTFYLLPIFMITAFTASAAYYN